MPLARHVYWATTFFQVDQDLPEGVVPTLDQGRGSHPPHWNRFSISFLEDQFRLSRSSLDKEELNSQSRPVSSAAPLPVVPIEVYDLTLQNVGMLHLAGVIDNLLEEAG